ncbi:aldehyde dehydrogenase family protein [Pontibacter mucosus]|uniref:Aldehyde dehydrogenase family protein n=1 Tax=Pontibacter mucosus TaxID=1649266 RepID=A0A2T5YCR0_9BACT|nr:aldehyde dehydrogenase family protein [Pontibacter mucosus]
MSIVVEPIIENGKAEKKLYKFPQLNGKELPRDNFIGGQFVPPVKGEYFDNISPINGKVFAQAARSTKEDVELALDAAHEAFQKWGKSSATERSNILLKVAHVVEDNLEYLATLETIDNGKPIRETRAADLPLIVDHFRYFAGVIRAEEGGISEHDANTVSIVLHEPIGVVGQIIPWNFPLLMAAWKIAPALAAGNCIVLKPAEQTPTSILGLMELIGEVLPAGVLNVVNGFGAEVGKALGLPQESAKLPLPAPRQQAGSSCSTLPRTLSLLPWSWAVSPRTSSSRP